MSVIVPLITTPALATRIDHVAVAVRDGDATAQWYVNNLGMRIDADERLEHVGVRLIALVPSLPRSDLGATFFQVAEPIGPGAVQTFLEQQGEGLHHICFALDDVTDSGSVVTSPPFEGGRDRRSCFVVDRPNTVIIEFTDASPHVGVVQ